MAGRDPSRVLVVGFGAAGLAVAENLRRAGFDGDLTILSGETHLPYDRPPLSKEFLTTDDPAPLALVSTERLDGLAADVRWGARACGLDVTQRLVRTSQGDDVAFDELVIATGVAPRTLPQVPSAPGVHVLRTLESAVGLREDLRAASSVAIIGGGFIGLECAASAVKLGLRVHVVEPVALPLAARLGEVAATALIDVHRSHGVSFSLGVSVESVEPGPRRGSGGRSWTAALTDGSRVSADMVLVCVGSVADLGWAAESGLDLTDGVVCDELCRAAPHVWAAGDVARWFHAGLGAHVRVEHRINAAEQGRAVARNIMGAQAPFLPLPFFWTDQYEHRIQLAGVVAGAGVETICEGSLDANEFVVTWAQGDEPGAVLGWNAARAMMPYRRALGERLAAR